GGLGLLGLKFESYTLALTDELLDQVFGAKLEPAVRAALADAQTSGYLGGPALAARFPGVDTAGQHWIRSGSAAFAPDPAARFFLPDRFVDPFGNLTEIEYDQPRHLFVAATKDALANRVSVRHFDFRVLAPREVEDANRNLSETYYDLLGLPAAVAVKGKGAE